MDRFYLPYYLPNKYAVPTASPHSKTDMLFTSPGVGGRSGEQGAWKLILLLETTHKMTWVFSSTLMKWDIQTQIYCLFKILSKCESYKLPWQLGCNWYYSSVVCVHVLHLFTHTIFFNFVKMVAKETNQGKGGRDNMFIWYFESNC